MKPIRELLVGQVNRRAQHATQRRRLAVVTALALSWPLLATADCTLRKPKADSGGATQPRWTGAPTARTYFASAIGSNERSEMVLWASSEQPDTGMGLVDYQTNAAVDRWLREKVLLAPSTTNCAVPKGVLGAEGGMLRVIGYGSEVILAYPPRPANPSAPWDPVWTAKVRVKSVASAMPGMTGMSEAPGRAADSPAPAEPAGVGGSPLNILCGIFGREYCAPFSAN